MEKNIPDTALDVTLVMSPLLLLGLQNQKPSQLSKPLCEELKRLLEK